MTAASAYSEKRWWILLPTILGTLMAWLDSSIVNVSIPAMMGDLRVSVNAIQWVLTSYMIAFASLMPLTSWMKDEIGGRRLFEACLWIFLGGSLLCGLSRSLEVLVFARVLQAIGGGAITPTAMAMISEAFPKSERGRALGYLSMGAVIGPACGPTLGGILTQAFGWPSIFLVNLPIGAVALFASRAVLIHEKPRAPIRWKNLDALGFALLASFLGSFLFALSRLGEPTFHGASVALSFLTAGVSLFAFLWHDFQGHQKILELRMFRVSDFRAAMGITMVRSAALFGASFLLPILLQEVFGYGETRVGLFLLPGSVALGMVLPIGARLERLHGQRGPVLCGLVGVLAFFASFAFIAHGPPELFAGWAGSLLVQLPIIVRGIGIGILVTPIQTAALGAFDAKKASMVSVWLNLAQQLGGAVGIAFDAMLVPNRTPEEFGRAFLVGALVAAGSFWFAVRLPGRPLDAAEKAAERKHGEEDVHPQDFVS